MKRRIGREKILQLLFQIDLAKADADEVIHTMVNETELNIQNLDFIKDRVYGVLEQLEIIDKTLIQYLKSWTINRLSIIDRAILRMSVYEFIYKNDVPISVTINEAIELSKTFSTSDSSKFINGVLGSMIKEHPEWEQEKVKLKE
ncbi:transcription antitermination factor NusB [Tepidibacillus marianensis]|uniref:transcription antitermination factor NusB n=1 Tax=Tepidibacillus marianensis TaxID=3131995 RepID=UPI0030CA802E